MLKVRNLRSDAPQRVREMVELLHPYFADGKRRVQPVNAGWKITWNVPQLDAMSIACLMDITNEMEDIRLEIKQDFYRRGWYVTIICREV